MQKSKIEEHKFLTNCELLNVSSEEVNAPYKGQGNHENFDVLMPH